MDYVVGSVAALISGNVTPNRPKLLRRALTPSKHQASPDVTPKSQVVEDRSIFLSPTLQKKKAIVKKSPKRIFQNPDLDITEEDGNKSLTSPKAEKVKKHLKDDLESDEMKIKSLKDQKSPIGKPSPKKNVIIDGTDNTQSANENTPTKKKKQKKSISEEVTETETLISNLNADQKSPSKATKKRKATSISEEETVTPVDNQVTSNTPSPKKKKRNKKKKQNNEVGKSESNSETKTIDTTELLESDNKSVKKGKKKNKKQKSKQNNTEPSSLESRIKSLDSVIANPNAITNKDTDSEHDSDDDIDSESENNNKNLLNTNGNKESSDEEEEVEPVKPQKKKKQPEKEVSKESPALTVDEIKRTLFVGNVPMSLGLKKKLKRIFSKHGEIQTVRIRSIPVKDATSTPKVAAIKNELHPERTTVNVYMRYKDAESVQKALSENNTVFEECHLRVTASDMNALDYDPSKAIFVGNLPFTIEDEQLREKFEKCGEIESVRIVRDRKTNVGKGFGFVNFKSKDGVELALALTDEDLSMKNRILRVKRIGEKPPKRNNQGKFQERQGNSQNRQGNSQNRHGNSQNKQANFQNRQGGNKPPGKFNQKPGGFNKSKNSTENENKIQNQKGAMKRLENKRKFQENGGGDGPPKEKKQKKEFVGVTAEKKKKRKFDKGQKKKKALSEILTK